MGRGPVAGIGRGAPSSEAAGPGQEHEELLNVLDALAADKSVREVAIDVLKADATVKWHIDREERSKAQRRIRKAKAYMKGRYREFLEPGRRAPPEGPETGLLRGIAALLPPRARACRRVRCQISPMQPANRRRATSAPATGRIRARHPRPSLSTRFTVDNSRPAAIAHARRTSPCRTGAAGC